MPEYGARYFIYLWAIVAIVSVAVAIRIATSPRRFWPLSVVLAVGTGGMMLDGYNFVDEILIGALLIGGLFAVSVGRLWGNAAWSRSGAFDWHKKAFTVLTMYMMLEGMRGLLMLDSARKIRWVVYYGMLYLIAEIASRNRSTVNRRQISVLVASTALVYFSLYLTHGVFSELVRGISWEDLQSVEWSGTTGAMFPMVIALPASLLLMLEQKRGYRTLAWTTVFMLVVAAFYYESRVAWLTLLGFVMVALRVIGVARTAVVAGIFILMTALFVGFVYPESYDTDMFIGELTGTIQGLAGKEVPGVNQDPFRRIQFLIAFPVISGGWETFLFGYGVRGVPPGTLGSVASSLAAEIAPERAEGMRNYDSTEGFTALLTETGVIGLLLVIANFVLTAKAVIVGANRPLRLMLVYTTLVTFLYLLVANILDFMLFYLMIMPSGVIIGMTLTDDGPHRTTTATKGEHVFRRIPRLRPHSSLG